MRKSLIALTFLFLPTSVYAQTAQTRWTQDAVTSTTQAQGFTYKLYQTVPTTPTPTTTTFTLTTVTCNGTPPSVTCSAPNPTGINLATGVKFELTATDTVNGSPESARSLPFIPGANAPTGLVIFK